MRKKNIFQKERPILRANDGISLEIYKGETFGLVGESGCGKSTFGRTVLQLQRPTSGAVTYFGKDGGVDLTKLQG
jgi:peptide/nickel transport system ATP-binding protein